MQPRLPVSSILGSFLRNVPLETELPLFIERRHTDAVAASNRATVAVPLFGRQSIATGMWSRAQSRPDFTPERPAGKARGPPRTRDPIGAGATGGGPYRRVPPDR
jgi:hypothetical protein